MSQSFPGGETVDFVSLPTEGAQGYTEKDAPISATGIGIENLSKAYEKNGAPLLVLDDTSISTSRGEFVTILGPSGCGKSTLFNIVAGLAQPTGGDVYLHGERVTGKTGASSYMMQRDLLMPWRTVLDNVILGLETTGVPRRQARLHAKELLERFGLGSFVDSYPRELSGGMRQRAAFIRTLLFPRDVLLLDEPLGALDAQTRLIMQEWLLQVWEEQRKTVLFITHDVEEAVFLSDKVYVMSARPGKIINEVAITLPRPRTMETRVDPQFLSLRAELLNQIHQESLRAFEETKS